MGWSTLVIWSCELDEGIAALLCRLSENKATAALA